jgi:hypothetical protein
MALFFDLQVVESGDSFGKERVLGLFSVRQIPYKSIFCTAFADHYCLVRYDERTDLRSGRDIVGPAAEAPGLFAALNAGTLMGAVGRF